MHRKCLLRYSIIENVYWCIITLLLLYYKSPNTKSNIFAHSKASQCFRYIATQCLEGLLRSFIIRRMSRERLKRERERDTSDLETLKRLIKQLYDELKTSGQPNPHRDCEPCMSSPISMIFAVNSIAVGLGLTLSNEIRFFFFTLDTKYLEHHFN